MHAPAAVQLIQGDRNSGRRRIPIFRNRRKIALLWDAQLCYDGICNSLIRLVQENVGDLLLIRNSGGLQHLRNIFAGGCHRKLKDLPAVHLYPRPSAWSIVDIERLRISLRMLNKSKETFLLAPSLYYRSSAAVSKQNARIPIAPVEQP